MMRRSILSAVAIAMITIAPVADAASICRECVRRPVEKEHPQLRRCYRELLKRKPGAQGRVLVRFSIEPSGETSHVAVTRNDLHDTRFGACIEAVFRTIRYQDAPRETVHIHYPLRFEP
jgi:hypothetical protein